MWKEEMLENLQKEICKFADTINNSCVIFLTVSFVE